MPIILDNMEKSK